MGREEKGAGVRTGWGREGRGREGAEGREEEGRGGKGRGVPPLLSLHFKHWRLVWHINVGWCAALDRVDHDVVLQGLEVVYGLTNTALEWIACVLDWSNASRSRIGAATRRHSAYCSACRTGRCSVPCYRSQFRLFFAKIEKIAYTRNGKDTPNIQIGITSFLYKISTQFLRV